MSGADDALAAVAAQGRVELAEGQLRQLGGLLELLGTDPGAPTSIREPAAAAGAHVGDSLAALELEAVRAAGSIVDVGSGAGFPGLPLAVALPAASVSLLESQRRKCAYLERAIEAAAAENAHVVCSRAEEWEAGLGGADVVVARAVGPQPVVLEYAAPLLRVGGVLVDWRGGRSEPEELAAARAAADLAMRGVEVRRVPPFPGAHRHHLHVFAKEGETPARFPRRAGVARKRPLGG